MLDDHTAAIIQKLWLAWLLAIMAENQFQGLQESGAAHVPTGQEQVWI